jgi:hypothetical protein
MNSEFPLSQPIDEGVIGLHWIRSESLSHRDNPLDYSSMSEEEIIALDECAEIFPGLKNTEGWNEFIVGYDQPWKGKNREQAWMSDQPMGIRAAPEIHDVWEVATFGLRVNPEEIETPEEASVALSRGIEAGLYLSQYFKKLISDESAFENFVKGVRKTRKIPSSFAAKTVLAGFMSYVTRCGKLPTKKELNQEASHWAYAKGFPEEGLKNLVGFPGPIFPESPIGRAQVVAPLRGFVKAGEISILWLLPYEKKDVPRFDRKEFRKHLNDLGLNHLPQS